MRVAHAAMPLDAKGSFHGEHLWYGGRSDMWGHRVRRLTPARTVTEMVRSRTGLRDDYKDFSLVRHREEWDLMEPVG